MGDDMICPRCDEIIEDGWNYCPICGYARNEMNSCSLYEKVMGDRREYRYGDELQATVLWIEGGYPTPEEAKAAWLRSLK